LFDEVGEDWFPTLKFWNQVANGVVEKGLAIAKKQKESKEGIMIWWC